MTQWTLQIEATADGRFRWRHTPVEGTGTATAHGTDASYDTAQAALSAGQEALQRHHETPLAEASESDAMPQTPLHEGETRLGGSQAELEALEDPRLPSDSPLSIASLPLEAQVRTEDLETDASPRT